MFIIVTQKKKKNLKIWQHHSHPSPTRRVQMTRVYLHHLTLTTKEDLHPLGTLTTRVYLHHLTMITKVYLHQLSILTIKVYLHHITLTTKVHLQPLGTLTTKMYLQQLGTFHHHSQFQKDLLALQH